MRKILCMLSFCVPAQLAICQEDSLLKKFKFRIDRFRAIGLGVNGSSQYNQSKTIAGSQSNSSSGSFNSSYYAIKSTDQQLLSYSFGLTPQFGSSKSENYKSRHFSGFAGIDVLNKHFNKNIFTELGISSTGFYNWGKDDNGKTTRWQPAITVTTGIGKGRLENITDMQNALWLNKALTTANSLSRPLSAEELIGLGKSITKGNSTRVLDNRKRIQYILETTDIYLQQKDLITKTDINYFSNLNDILFFAINIPRLSGTEKFIRFKPSMAGWEYSNNLNNNNFKYQDNFNTQSLDLSSGFSTYAPSSLVHQNNYGASVELSYIFIDINRFQTTNGIIDFETKGKDELKQAALNLFYQHSIYPNTRTIIHVNITSETGYQYIDRDKVWYQIANLSGVVNYFISYRTRFVFNAGATYQTQNYTALGNLIRDINRIQLFVSTGLEINL